MLCSQIRGQRNNSFGQNGYVLGPDLRRVKKNDKISPIGMVYLMYHLLGTVKLNDENETPH